MNILVYPLLMWFSISLVRLSWQVISPAEKNIQKLSGNTISSYQIANDCLIKLQEYWHNKRVKQKIIHWEYKTFREYFYASLITTGIVPLQFSCATGTGCRLEDQYKHFITNMAMGDEPLWLAFADRQQEFLDQVQTISGFLSAEAIENTVHKPRFEVFTTPSRADQWKGIIGILDPLQSTYPFGWGVVKVTGTFSTVPLEKQATCRDAFDPDCLPNGTGTSVLVFHITDGKTPWFQRGDSISLGCYDAITHHVIHETSMIDVEKMTSQVKVVDIDLNEESREAEQMNAYVMSANTTQEKTFYLFIAPNVQLSPHWGLCVNRFFNHPLEI